MKNYLLFFLGFSLSLPLSSQTNAAWQQTSGPEGGNVYNLERNATTIYAGTENGLWSSSDEGQNWESVNPALNDLRVVSQFVSGNEILALAIKFISSYDDNPYFLRSTDAGQTWTQIAIYENPPYIYLSTSGDDVKVWRDGGRIWINSQTALFYSTDDGLNWTQIVAPPNAYFYEAAVYGKNILAYDYYAQYRSSDLGANWTITQDTAYNSDLFSDGPLLLLLGQDSIFTSTDFGQSWLGKPTNLSILNGIKRASDGSFILFSNEIYHSADGLSWQQTTQSSQNYGIGSGVESGSSYVVAGTGGIFHTVQSNSEFEPYQNGFIGSRINSMAALPNGRLIVSTTYNGIWSSFNDGLHWVKTPGPSSSIYSNIQLNEMIAIGDTLWAIGANDSLYQLVGNSNVWTKILDVDAWFAGESIFRVIDHDLYLVEGERIRRTKDGGAHWETLVVDAGTFYGLRDIAKFGNYLFFTTNDGLVYRSGDDGANWTLNYSFSSPGAHRYNKLGVSGGKLIIWSEYESFYSTDNGDNWQLLGMTGLPQDSWGDVYFEPGEILYFQNLIMCTIPFNGVWISFDQGNSWEPLNNGLKNLRGKRLVSAGSNIFMGAVTSGVWRLGAEFEVFSGLVFNDQNQNGVKDNGELPLKNIILSAEPLGSYNVSDDAGVYSLVAASGLDSIRVSLPNAYSSALPPFRQANQPGTGYDFGIHFTEGAIDLKLDITNWEPFRPGFDNDLSLTVSNVGNETVNNAWVEFLIPNGISVISTNPFGGVTIVGDTLKWSLGALAPFEHTTLQVSVLVATNVSIGDVLLFSGKVNVANDLAPENNYAVLREIVVGSYDPNDKSAAAYITPEDLAHGKPIEYTIRFENTGTFYAEKVVIHDALESHLNPATFQWISSSHPCTWQLRSDGAVTFTFSNLLLFPGETGFVKFSVAADPGLALNETIYNTADIVFDFNTPIITNTVKTQVKWPLSGHNPASAALGLQISPNPTRDNLLVTIPPTALRQAQSLRILDQQGKLVRREVSLSGQMRLQLSGLDAGIYHLVLEGKQQEILSNEMFVIVR
ncbi:MAG: T9SS type A sorting domain-containing protein [Phycisphaerae bacterium]|nr:T9SS type A sorting domain-containing protein [Saprospiraceae bacterium]